MVGELREKLIFEVETPKMNGGGFKSLLAELKALDAAMGSINSKFTGMVNPAAFRKTKAQVEKELKSFQQKISKSTPMEIGKFLGMDERLVSNFFGKATAQTTGYFRSASAAASGFSKLTREAAKNVDVTSQAFANFMSGNSRGLVPTAVPALKVEGVKAALDGGMIPLIVPASRVQATLEGAVTLTIPAGMVQGTMATGGAPAGGVMPGSPIPNMARPKVAASAAAMAGDIVEEVTKTTTAGVTTSITRALAPFVTQTVTEGPQGRSSTTIRKQQGKALVERVNDQMRLELEGLQTEMARRFTGNKPKDLKVKAEALRKTASSLELLEQQSNEQLKSAGQTRVAQALQSRVGRLRAEAVKVEAQAVVEQKKSAEQARKEQAGIGKRERSAVAREDQQLERQRKDSLASQERFAKTTEREKKQRVTRAEQREQAEEKRREALRAEQAVTLKGAQGRSLLDTAGALGFQVQNAKEKEFVRRGKPIRSVETVLSKEDGGMVQTRKVVQEFDQAGKLLNSRLEQTQRALKATRDEAGVAGRDFLKNTAQVTLWAASVATLYGTLGLAQRSFKSATETGLQTARLTQVFHGVGGSAKQLRDDVLELAAAHGRESKEALDAAIAWSRVGLTRAQVNEAVRVSLVAANVAELEAGEATKHLQAIYMAYGLTVGQLNGVLGELNETSNNFNVTNREMLEGISRTVGVAKQAGLGLSELIGLIGATVGSTGQSGAQIGNAVKALTVRLNSPELQKFLRQEFKIEVTQGGGAEIKTMSDLLADLYVNYQRLTEMEKNHLLVRVAGTHQASRVASLLDHYVKAQILAIQAQQNLNSAEEENNLIRATMAAQLTGLAAEWDRFVSNQADNAIMPALIEATEALKNLIALLNTPVGSMGMTAVVAVLTAMSVRMVVAVMQMSKLRAEAGFVSNTFARATAVMHTMNEAMGMANARAMAMFRSLGRGLNPVNLLHSGFALLGKGLAQIQRLAAYAGRAMMFMLTSTVQMLPAMAAGWAAMKLFNYGMEKVGKSSETAERKLAGFNAEAERSAKAASAAMQAAKLLDTSQRALANMRRPEQRDRLIQQLGDGKILSGAATQAALAAAKKGDMETVNRLLQEERGRRITTASVERQNEYRANQKEIEETQRELARLKEIPTASQAKQQELENHLQDLEGKRTRLIFRDTEEVGDAMQEWLDADTEHQIKLERQKVTLEAIAEIYRSLPANSPMDRYQLELAGKNAQLGFLDREREGLLGDKTRIGEDGQAEMDRIAKERVMVVSLRRRAEERHRELMIQNYAGPGVNPSEDPVYLGLIKQASDLESHLNVRGGNVQAREIRNRDMLRANEEARRKQEKDMEAHRAREEFVRQQTRMDLAARQARDEAEQFGFGRTDAERMDNREQGLRGLLQKKLAAAEKFKQGDDPVAQENRIVQALQHRLDLVDTILDKERLRYQLQRDELQLLQDKQRELQKSLITAGPDEMLRKLAAFEAGRRGVTPGQFWAMSPEMRQAIMDQNPRLSPEMAEIRRNRGLLGPGGGAEGVQRDIGKLDEVFGRLTELLAPLVKEPAQRPDELAAERAAIELDNFSTKVSVAGERLQDLSGIIERLSKFAPGINYGPGEGRRTALPQAGGFAPGAQGN